MRGTARRMLLVGVGIGMAACTTVKVRQVGTCWVRETSKWMGSSRQEVGPCSREAPVWAQDRYTRLVQECIAQTDHQWFLRALSSWERNEPLPAREPQDAINLACMEASVAPTLRDNEALQSRLDESKARIDEAKSQAAEVKSEAKSQLDEFKLDRDVLLDKVDKRLADELQFTRTTSGQLVDYLGDAANRPTPTPQPAIATATATSGSGSDSQAASKDSKDSKESKESKSSSKVTRETREIRDSKTNNLRRVTPAAPKKPALVSAPKSPPVCVPPATSVATPGPVPPPTPASTPPVVSESAPQMARETK